MHHEHALLIWIFWVHCYFIRVSFLAAFFLADAFVCLTCLPVFDTPSYQPRSTLPLHPTTQHFPKHPQFLPRDRERFNYITTSLSGAHPRPTTLVGRFRVLASLLRQLGNRSHWIVANKPTKWPNSTSLVQAQIYTTGPRPLSAGLLRTRRDKTSYDYIQWSPRMLD